MIYIRATYGVNDVPMPKPGGSTQIMAFCYAPTIFGTAAPWKTRWHMVWRIASGWTYRRHTDQMLEMVHAYDHLRFKMQWRNNLRHAACTEIRASSLSGECRWTREFFIKHNFKLPQQHQECVRRRAALSLRGRPDCRDDVHAAQMVNEVWESCFPDTRPFDEIYR